MDLKDKKILDNISQTVSPTACMAKWLWSDLYIGEGLVSNCHLVQPKGKIDLETDDIMSAIREEV